MQIPEPRGPLSEFLAELLLDGCGSRAAPPAPRTDTLADGDLQLALYLVHELSYGGLEHVDDDRELDPPLLRFPRASSRRCSRLCSMGRAAHAFAPAAVPEAIFELIEKDDGPPLARFIEKTATLEQVREFLIHRSAYQLKEADPHTFGIPRITGPAKAAMVEIQADEYGGGDPSACIRPSSRRRCGSSASIPPMVPTSRCYRPGRWPRST